MAVYTYSILAKPLVPTIIHITCDPRYSGIRRRNNPNPANLTRELIRRPTLNIITQYNNDNNNNCYTFFVLAVHTCSRKPPLYIIIVVSVEPIPQAPTTPIRFYDPLDSSRYWGTPRVHYCYTVIIIYYILIPSHQIDRKQTKIMNVTIILLYISVVIIIMHVRSGGDERRSSGTVK